MNKMVELVDLLKLVYSFAKSIDVEVKELERIRQGKHDERGGFRERIFLESVNESI